MKFALLLFYLWVLPASLLCQPQPQIDSLVILHWNDFHAQNTPFDVTSPSDRSTKYRVGGEPLFAGYIRDIRKSSVNVLVVSGGDEFQGTPISNFTCGRSQIELLNLLHPDAMVLGNHEFDYGADSLRANLARATFPILCSNVIDLGKNSTFGLPFAIKNFGNLKIGILGATSPGLERLTLKKNLEGLRLRNIDSSLSISLAELRKQEEPNLIILLSHEGLKDDSVLALSHPEINVIISSHDHRALFIPMKVGKSIIVEAGSKGQYLGELTLAIDAVGDSIVSYSEKLIETKGEGIQPDSIIAAKVTGFEGIVNQGLSQVIGELKTPWTRGERESYESNIGDFESDAFRSFSMVNADVAFVNSAGIRKDLDAGPIKIRDIWEINPFGNTLINFIVRGDTLRHMIEWQAGKPTLQVSGLKYSFKKKEGYHADLVSLTVGDKLLDEKKYYTITTSNYVGEHFKSYFGIDPSAISITDTGVIDRDIVIEAVKQQKVITSSVEDRIRSVNEDGSAGKGK
ncbi:MAG: bifunctional metallophosphatase/5'-nucleotidase [Bacteroidota bacterium]